MGIAHRLRPWLFGLLAAGVLLEPAIPVWAGAWTLPEDRWYAEYFYRLFQSKKEFDTDGDSHRRAKVGMFRDLRSEWKLEYGLTDWWNLLANVPYQSSHFRDDDTDLLTTGVGDIYLRTKLRFLNTKTPLADEEPLVGSLQFSWKIPSAYDPNVSPALGDGQVDFESRLQLSQSWVYWPYEVRLQAQRPAAAHRPPPASPRSVSQSSWRARREAAMRQAVLNARLMQALDHQADPASSTEPSSRSPRELAIRHALLAVQLYQEGRRFAYRGWHREAAACLQAALAHDPSHEDAARLWLHEALAATEVIDAYPFYAVSAAGQDRLEPVPSHRSETETRYAGVAFINLEAGFTGRNEDPANEFPIFLEAGFTPLKRLMLVGSLESVISVKSTDEQTEDFAKWGVRAILNLWGEGFASVFKSGEPTVNFEVGYNEIFAGRNTADAYELFAKLGMFF